MVLRCSWQDCPWLLCLHPAAPRRQEARWEGREGWVRHPSLSPALAGCAQRQDRHRRMSHHEYELCDRKRCWVAGRFFCLARTLPFSKAAQGSSQESCILSPALPLICCTSLAFVFSASELRRRHLPYSSHRIKCKARDRSVLEKMLMIWCQHCFALCEHSVESRPRLNHVH